MSRCLDLHVLIIVQSGTLNIELDGVRRKVGAHEYIILPASINHCGWRDADTETPLRYFWAHFVFKGQYTLSHSGTLPLFGTPTEFSRVSILTKQLLDISQLPDTDKNYCNFVLSSLLCELASQSAGNGVSSSTLVNRLISWINLNVYEPVSLSDAALAFGYDKKYLARLFKQGTGMTVNQMIVKKKMDIAKQYLTGSDERIAAIAERLGYGDAGYFMRLFKKNEGVTCTAYRAAYSRMYQNHT
jgi:AraC-like DNA-binding protein